MFGSYKHEGEIGGRGRRERDYNYSYVRVGVIKLGRKEGSVKCFRVAKEMGRRNFDLIRLKCGSS